MFEYNKETRTAVVCGVGDKFCEQIVIPSTVEYYRKKYDVVAIKEQAFSECLKLKSVTIPDSVTEIGRWAFHGCSSLTSITIPNRVTEIEGWAFHGCSSLTSITIPDSVTAIRVWAFYGCSSLTSITIPDSITAIEYCAFEGCSHLKNVDICNEKGCVDIGYDAFGSDVKVTYLGKDAQPKKKGFFARLFGKK